METEFIHINLFYPLLFLVIITLIVTVGIVVKGIKGDDTFKSIFNVSSNNAKDITVDTTTKMKSMHDNVVHIQFGQEHEKELHKLEENIKDLNDKVDLLFERVIRLEQDNR